MHTGASLFRISGLSSIVKMMMVTQQIF